ncbi:unnamed protein product [marine sediment metagenome]|uniref:Zinc-ribbon domain-containing protein n=1 Tax=marine sediment metagenome TaxID=412755 RepID=X1TTK0_9ZZZZ
MKIKRYKKIKKLLNSNKNDIFGDKIKLCPVCSETILDKNAILCPNCKTNLNNIKTKYKIIKNKLED